jgi:SAM-dependent methyltransferase
VVRSGPFEAHSGRYDEWFMRHLAVYHSELLAVRAFLPWEGMGLEVGVGTGRFAAPLGVAVGMDPAMPMLLRAQRRNITVVQGVVESLPFVSEAFDYALMVVVLSFLDNPKAGLVEVFRVLRPGGRLVIGFLDQGSRMGRGYISRHAQRVFFRDATFYASDDVEKLLDGAGFQGLRWGQTLCRAPEEIVEVEPLRPGRGDGTFVVVSAART